MTINALYNCKITLIINGESYILDQNPNNPIVIDDQRQIEAIKTPNGGFVSYGTNMQMPYMIDFDAVNVNKAITTLLTKTFEENNKNNPDYRFTTVFEGFNNQNEAVKVTFNDCILRQSPLQIQIAQDVPTVRVLLYAREKINE